MKHRLLVVDDDEDIRSQMRWALCEDYDVALAEDRSSALNVFHSQRPAVVLLDLGLPPHPGDTTEGMSALAALLAQEALTKVIIVTGQSDKEHALRAVGEGAYDFLCKPVEMDELKIILRRAFQVALLEREYRSIQNQLAESSFESMLGTSPQMQEVFTKIRKVATSDAPVLVLGESGTGKEMTALAVHRRSSRKDGPFVAINCGAIPEALLESELFGHEKGAFTGAHAQRPGRFETADGGTLFLDEVGELPLQLQVKLLRFLQEQKIERLGGRKEIPVDTRIVAATNADLTQLRAEGKFREDLYYRLSVVAIHLPPLRERRNDLTLLAKAFLRKASGQNGKSSLRFTPEALLAIENHPWPGNVRELENRVRRAVIMADSNRVTPADLELADPVPEPILTLKEARDQIERQMVERALARHNDKISPAAAELGVSRPTLYELMERLGLKREKTE
jgi:two-component system NtrC family response regulator